MRAVFTLIGILILAVAASALAEFTMVYAQHSPQVAEAPSPTPSATPTPTPSPSATPTASPTVTPVATPTARTVVTNGFVHMRAGASTATAIVTDLQGGTVLTLGAYSDSQWQQVSYNSLNGYVFKAYLTY